MAVLESIASVVAKAIAERVLRGEPGDRSPKGPERRLEAAVKDHLREVANWTSKVHTLDASAPRDLKASTIPLGLDKEPKRVRPAEPKHSIKQEQDLLSDDANYLILGNPGSGKTTTIKRIASRLLLEPPAPDDQFQFPIVIRLRELADGMTVSMALASALGLKYETTEIKGRSGGFAVTRYETRIGDEPIELVITRLFSDLGAVIFLDGLDEVWSEARTEVSQEISQLARGISGSKIIVSSRTGDYTFSLENFTVLQLCPLRPDQIREIALKWLKDPSNFIVALEALPYRDIADRPLLLTQLLLLYSRYGFLPEQPAQVYKRVIRILLEEWDAQRNVRRQSKYAGFDPDRKTEFLAAIAFHITYTHGRSQFDEDELVAAYGRIHQVFNLPWGDARQVARELEAHTGIIVEAGRGIYEFSHLSIQEYLSASYLVRSASPALIRRALAGHPAPVAIAVALSSQPAEWLARLILNPDHQAWVDQGVAKSFLSRLLIERPFFEAFEPLGWASMHLFSRFSRAEGKVPDVALHFGRMPGVKRSIAEALRWYVVTSGDSVKGSDITLRRREGLTESYDVGRPNDAVLPRLLLQEIVSEWPDAEIWLSRGGKEKRSVVRALAS